MQLKVTTIALLCLLSSSEALRILAVFHVYTKSHSILGHGIVNTLVNASHEVVHVTGFPSKKKIPNLTEIDVSLTGDTFAKYNTKDGMNLKNQVSSGNMPESLYFLYVIYRMHEQMIQDPQVLKLLNDPEQHFDLVITEWFFAEIFAGLAPLYQCPLIWFTSTELHGQVLRLIDQAPNPAYTVELFAASRPPLNFWERASELFKLTRRLIAVNALSILEKRLYNQIYEPAATKRGIIMPPYEDAIYNASLMFVNSHPSVGSIYRVPASVINIAGIHINEKSQPLSKDLQKVMDEAKHGVIYFSMGSVLESKDMSDNMKQTFIKIFSKLKETVVWKFEDDLKNLPHNVYLVNWAPQQSILAHPNLKFFITHDGQLSTTEAVHYGVPLIGLPIMADQWLNMIAVENKGFGIKVHLTEDKQTEEILSAAIQDMLRNDTYNLRAKELSMIYHDRTASPSEELLHWVQHVVKTRGALHLRSPALHVPLYQKLYLDLAAVVIPLLVVLYLLIKMLLQLRLKIAVIKQKKEKRN